MSDLITGAAPPSPAATPPKAESTSHLEHRVDDVHLSAEVKESFHPGGLHPVVEGDFYVDRYRILKKLGYGAFSTVWLAQDEHNDSRVAIKFCRADYKPADFESLVHERLKSLEERSHRAIVEPLGYFEIVGPNGIHVCQTFELMGPSAYITHPKGLKETPRRARFPIWMVKIMFRQILVGLSDLHLIGICHGDLHTGNILFKVRGVPGDDHVESASCLQTELDPPPVAEGDGTAKDKPPEYLYDKMGLEDIEAYGRDVQVKVADLGSAFSINNIPENLISPATLRAPELVLKAPLSYGIDIWSFGCILFESLTGDVLFNVHDMGDERALNDDHLEKMTDILGPLPEELLAKWPTYSSYYDANGVKFHSSIPDGDPQSDGHVFMHPSLEEVFDTHRPEDCDDLERDKIIALIRKILRYNHEDRPSAEELLLDPWFESG